MTRRNKSNPKKPSAQVSPANRDVTAQPDGPREPCGDDPAASVHDKAPPAAKAPVDVAPTPLYAVATKKWFAMEEAVVGLAHRVRDLPCQDAARATAKNRACMILADGAGSSAVSEIGARAVVTGLVRLADTLTTVLAERLDQGEDDPQALRSLGLLFVKHAVGILADLAAEHRRDLRDFRSTLLLCLTGQKRHLWLKVGDGALVAERQLLCEGSLPQAYLVSLGRAGKGEFANETQFLDAVQPVDVQTGYLPANEITGLALMSDGAAERLVSNDGQTIGKRVSALLQELREEKLRRSKLTRMFYEDGFCDRSSGDDRAIALLATGFDKPVQEPQTHKPS